MLFHITSTHTEDNCPGYRPELVPAVMEGLSRREEIAQEHNVKIHWMLSSTPGHSFYALLEAQRQVDIQGFVHQVAPFPQDHTVTPVMTVEDLEEVARQMQARAQA